MSLGERMFACVLHFTGKYSTGWKSRQQDLFSKNVYFANSTQFITI